LERAYVFVSASRGEPGDFERMLTLPLDQETDPSRGALTFTRLEDHRRGVSRERDPETGTLAKAERLPGRPAGSVWQRWLGWATAGTLVAGLVALYLKRRVVP
jgi:hypothetical protein